MDLKGFKKVSQSGGSYVQATFYNMDSKDEFTMCVRDYDYSDGSRDDDELYYMEIDEEARVDWLHKHGQILKGDQVKVIKGRKVKVGTIAKVVGKREIKDQYGRWVADYVILDNGQQTNVTNCVRV